MLDARKVNHAQKVIEGLNEPELTAVVLGLQTIPEFVEAWERTAAPAITMRMTPQVGEGTSSE